MARRGSARSLFFALLAASGAGAAQLGLAYGLGIISWEPTRGDAHGANAATIASGAWTSGLTWATFIAATSVVIGAVVGDRLRDSSRSGMFAQAAWRLVLAMVATIGALIVIPLVGVPASQAHIGGNYAPHLLVGVYAATGAVIGMVVSLVAMATRAVAANVFATASWLWALANIAIADGDTSDRGHGYAQLGVWKFTDAGPVWHSYYLPGALLLLGSALLVGGTAAFAAAARGDGTLGVAISGAAGPLLVLASYMLARPDNGIAPPEQLSAFYVCPYMVVAGFAGSVLVTAVGGGFSRRSRRSLSDAVPATRSPHDVTLAG